MHKPPPTTPPVRALYLHQAAPDSPRVRGHRWRYGSWYLLAAEGAGKVRVITGPHCSPARAWEHAPALAA